MFLAHVWEDQDIFILINTEITYESGKEENEQSLMQLIHKLRATKTLHLALHERPSNMQPLCTPVPVSFTIFPSYFSLSIHAHQLRGNMAQLPVIPLYICTLLPLS